METSTGGYTYFNDAVGNRLWRNYLGSDTSKTVKYTWDDLNRMTGCQSVAAGARYAYRADGMRVKKVEGISLAVTTITEEDEEAVAGEASNAGQVSGYGDAIASNLPTTRYFYDGQMPVEEDYTHSTANGTVVDLTKYGCGPRGMDFAAAYTKTGSGSYSLQSEAYPIYDTHGNSMFMLSKSSGSYALGNEKNYDAWGGQIGTNVPQQGYCANLGHRLDSESGLVYLRARYYEPGTGRFISEDPARDGINWYVYATNDPVSNGDFDGKLSFLLSLGMLAGLVFAVQAICEMRFGNIVEALASASQAIGYFALAFTADKYIEGHSSSLSLGVSAGNMLMNGAPFNGMLAYVDRYGLPKWLRGLLPNLIRNTSAGSDSLASVAVMGSFIYTLVVAGALIAIDYTS